MENLADICIICEDTLLDRRDRPTHGSNFGSNEDELMDLKFFLCKELSIPLSCFEYGGFPFCQKCTTTRVKELMRVRNQLLALQISYDCLKQNFLREIVTVYLRKNFPVCSLNSAAKATNVIIKKWKNYISNSGCLPSADNETFKNEFLNLYEPEVKDEICEQELNDNSTADENDYDGELESLSPNTNQILLKYTDDNILKLEDIPKDFARNSRTTRLNYCESPRKANIYNDDDKNTRSRKNRKGTKRKVASCSVKVSNVNNEKKITSRRVLKLFKCPHCPQELKGKNGLQAHIRIHTNDRPFVCSECNQAFRQEPHLRTHKKLRHGYEGKTQTVQGLNEIASKCRSYHCAYCSSVCKYKGFYIRHVVSTHLGKEYQEGHPVWFYYCDATDCFYSCAYQHQLKNHFWQCHKDLLSENNPEFPKCDKCEQFFTSQENLTLHKSSHHLEINDDPSIFGCKYCIKTFQSTEKLNEHLPRHEVTYNSAAYCHLCDFCGNSYSELSSLLAHKRKAHKMFFQNPDKMRAKTKTYKRTSTKKSSRNYECGFCFSQYTNEARFIRHLKLVHLGNQTQDGDSFWFYNCDDKDCKAAFTSLNRLNEHFQASHKNIFQGEIPQCNICQRRFVVQENLEQHKFTHPDSEIPCDQLKFACDYCPDIFSNDFELKKHSSEHQIIFDLSAYSVVCELCGEGFRNDKSLYQHKSVVHKRTRKKPKNRELRTNENKRARTSLLECPICHFKTSIPTNLQLHTEKIHPEVITRHQLLKHRCQYCEKCFYVPNDVHRHSIRYHSSEYLNGKSYCCSCYATFDTEEEMEAHYQLQHPHLICSVEECKKKFYDKKRLKLHMNVHNKEKPFLCEYCQQGFSQEASLQFHINTKHTFHRSFLCKLCPDNPGYYERRTFTKHLETDHPTCAVKDILITNYPKRKYFF